MEFEQKVEQLNLVAIKDYQKVFKEESALGWEVISTNINNDYGRVMIVTYRRSTKLKLYQRFVDLSNKVDILRKSLYEEGTDHLNSCVQEYKIGSFLVILAILIYILLVPFSIILLIAGFAPFRGNNIIAGLVGLLISGALIYFHVNKRKILKDLLTSKSEKFIQIENQIESLIDEARKLDHSII